jgi:putative transposase
MGRRSIRLGGYDYSYPGAYFVTVCATRRGLVFGWISDGRVVENANASIVRDCWLDLPNHYPHVSLDTFVVMPDHIHGIIVLRETDGAGGARAGLKPAPTGGGGSADVGVRHGLPEIVRALKTYSARRINATRGTPGASIWQRGYYERIVRNERELKPHPKIHNQQPTQLANKPRTQQPTPLTPPP